MRFYIISILLLVRTSCLAQKVSEKLLYELSEAVAGEHFMLSTEFRPSTEKRELVPGIDRIELLPDITKATSVVWLLDHNPEVLEYTQAKAWLTAYATSSKSENVLLSHFSQVDLAYMRQQLATADTFRFRQNKIQMSWIKIEPLDTLRAVAERNQKNPGSWEKKYSSGAEFYHMSRPLFTKNLQRALVTYGSSSYGEIVIYKKSGGIWYEEKRLWVWVS